MFGRCWVYVSCAVSYYSVFVLARVIVVVDRLLRCTPLCIRWSRSYGGHELCSSRSWVRLVVEVAR